MGGAVKVDIVQGVLIGLKDAVEAIALGVEDVAIECETMRGTARVVDPEPELTAESKERKLFISVVELKDVSH